ncbi:MAG: tRNA pseudouridine(55) synthase TruB, partial [Clostridiales bacterium]|nr:tRNA pseudouridine(55) synthase TruB [Clostridiales bacterium]
HISEGYSGIINVFKEKGMTSHDVTSNVKRIFNAKAGHAGTLDPQAEGILPVCVGKCTRLADHLGDIKAYRAWVFLGTQTDTQDTSGKELERRPVSWDEKAIEETALSFVGDIEQLPPMYSAIKIDGRKLYDLAREGKVVERALRHVTIHELKVTAFHKESCAFEMEVTCSKGTYIRTLAHDIGAKLGCGAAMGDLVRLRSGYFGIEGSIRLGDLRLMKDEGRLQEALLAPENILPYPKAQVSAQSERLARNGNPIPARDVSYSAEVAESGKCLLMIGKDFAGLYETRQKWGEDWLCSIAFTL